MTAASGDDKEAAADAPPSAASEPEAPPAGAAPVAAAPEKVMPPPIALPVEDLQEDTVDPDFPSRTSSARFMSNGTRSGKQLDISPAASSRSAGTAGSSINMLRRQVKSINSGRFNSIGPEDDDNIVRRDSTETVTVPETLSQEGREFLTKVMQTHFLFSSVERDEYEAIFRNMRKIPTSVDQVIFDEGDPGDACYFIKSGSYAVSISKNKICDMGANQTFGELALLYSMPRSGTIVCTDEGELWMMDRARFVQCMEGLSGQNTNKACAFFHSDMNFRCLQEEHQKLLAGYCSVQRFRDGDLILREGETGKWMFLLISGKVIHGKSTDVPISGSVVGSVGFMYDKPQPVSVKASGPVVCLSVGKKALAEAPQPIVDVFRRNALKTLLVESPSAAKSVFPNLTHEQLHRVCSMFEEATLAPLEIIYSPGDQAQLVLVIDGEAVVCKSQDGSGEEKVLFDGHFYGEEELISQTKMDKYMVVTAPARVHRLLHSSVERAFGEAFSDAVSFNEVKKVLQDIFLFKNLKEEQIDHTVRRLQKQRFAANEIICKQGDPANLFYLIQAGTILIKIGDLVVRTLGAWDYFGERGILMNETRSATCQACENCICLVLDKDDFFDIVGFFKKELIRRMHLQDLNITISDLVSKAVVGRGTFGTVRLVHHHEEPSKEYALKGVKKLEVVKGAQQRSIVMEREVNKQCYHPCIMQFIKTFQDKDHVYFLTEFLGGGDLFFAIREIGYLTKLHTQFYSGTITLALEYLHHRGIMYRDLKPENVLLDFNGAAKLVDFGCCKKDVRTHTLIGTPDYMAPEVIKRQGYTCTCDWWSLGVMLHEFVVGPLPFGADATDQMSLFKAILKEELVFPDYIVDEAVKNLIASLLERKTDKRLASSARGAKDIKAHGYYSDFNWDALGGGFHDPPFTPDTEAMKKSWEASDGDLTEIIGSNLEFEVEKGMEWAKGF